METQDCIKSRRTIRQFKAQDVGQDQVHIIVEAGKWAPSAGNLQNWRFIVVRDPDVKTQLADACVQQLWIETAPVVLVIVSDLEKAGEFYGTRGKDVYSRHNAAACGQNMLLAAHDIGLASAWVGAFDEDMIARTLGLPSGQRAEVVLPFGYADEKPAPPPRFLYEGLVYLNKWGNRFDDVALSMAKTGPFVKEQVTKSVGKLKSLAEKFQQK